MEKIISNSKWRAKHPFATQNTQHIYGTHWEPNTNLRVLTGYFKCLLKKERKKIYFFIKPSFESVAKKLKLKCLLYFDLCLENLMEFLRAKTTYFREMDLLITICNS